MSGTKNKKNLHGEVCGRYMRLCKMCWEEKSKGFLLYMNVRMIKIVLSMGSCKIYNGEEWQQRIYLNGWPLSVLKFNVK
jgi:hypothetical protein